MSHDYFKLRKPLDHRIYELARKHCENKKIEKYNLNHFIKKQGQQM
ncbi:MULTISPECIES: replication initiator protein A [unclassified Commensalibacter]|nr:replication initiator protein A [Commensalibacter sp. M0265]MBH9978040.1 replication initiator protein A [Commensalibacter sp. M0266]MBI0047216.1 replication initiator protein A [Commensalibacter sp. M0267]MBI0056882.1 replication initiator protein A [Commensalibacter sp. M0268]